MRRSPSCSRAMRTVPAASFMRSEIDCTGGGEKHTRRLLGPKPTDTARRSGAVYSPAAAKPPSGSPFPAPGPSVPPPPPPPPRAHLVLLLRRQRRMQRQDDPPDPPHPNRPPHTPPPSHTHKFKVSTLPYNGNSVTGTGIPVTKKFYSAEPRGAGQGWFHLSGSAE